jgi:hypothetical protein
VSAEPGALFDMAPPGLADEAVAGGRLSDGRRRTIRQLALLRSGRHPIGMLRLHPDAPPAGDRDAPGPRCGTCRFREMADSNGNRSFPKCLRGWDGDPVREPPYATHGAATDCRAWWPACEYYEATRPVPA